MKQVIDKNCFNRSALSKNSKLKDETEKERKLWESEEKKLREEICCLKKDNAMLIVSSFLLDCCRYSVPNQKN